MRRRCARAIASTGACIPRCVPPSGRKAAPRRTSTPELRQIWRNNEPANGDRPSCGSLPALRLPAPSLGRHDSDDEAIASGPFAPTRESLRAYQVPEWFRDAKFGIWAHWGPQSAPEAGDWYARRMYMQGDKTYDYHLKTYGHPSKFGFKDVIPTWKGDRFDPGYLLGLYKKAGAKYFVSMGVHHDNFDLWN